MLLKTCPNRQESREELGTAFSLEVRLTVQRIQKFPKTWPVLDARIVSAL